MRKITQKQKDRMDRVMAVLDLAREEEGKPEPKVQIMLIRCKSKATKKWEPVIVAAYPEPDGNYQLEPLAEMVMRASRYEPPDGKIEVDD